MSIPDIIITRSPHLPNMTTNGDHTFRPHAPRENEGDDRDQEHHPSYAQPVWKNGKIPVITVKTEPGEGPIIIDSSDDEHEAREVNKIPPLSQHASIHDTVMAIPQPTNEVVQTPQYFGITSEHQLRQNERQKETLDHTIDIAEVVPNKAMTKAHVQQLSREVSSKLLFSSEYVASVANSVPHCVRQVKGKYGKGAARSNEGVQSILPTSEDQNIPRLSTRLDILSRNVIQRSTSLTFSDSPEQSGESTEHHQHQTMEHNARIHNTPAEDLVSVLSRVVAKDQKDRETTIQSNKALTLAMEQLLQKDEALTRKGLEIEALNLQITHHDEAIASAEFELGKYQVDIQGFVVLMDNYERNQERFERDISIASNNLNTKDRNIQDLQSKFDAVTSELSTIQQEFKQKYETLEKKLQEATSNRDDLLKDRLNHQDQVIKLQYDIQVYTDQIGHCKEEIADLQRNASDYGHCKKTLLFVGNKDAKLS